MKKKIKKLTSLALAFVFMFALCSVAFAAEITINQAKSVALDDAGYAASEVSRLVAENDYENGAKVYEVSFDVYGGDGSVTEYDYKIKAADGKILEKEIDKERVKNQQSAGENAENVGAEQAKRIALEYFGVDAQDVKFTVVSKDYDDGRAVYEIEFCEPYSVKYSCEVFASNGKVVDAEKENVIGFVDKLELFFEVLIFAIVNR